MHARRCIVALWCVGGLLLRCLSDSCHIHVSLLQLHKVSYLFEVGGSGSNLGTENETSLYGPAPLSLSSIVDMHLTSLCLNL